MTEEEILQVEAMDAEMRRTLDELDGIDPNTGMLPGFTESERRQAIARSNRIARSRHIRRADVGVSI